MKFFIRSGAAVYDLLERATIGGYKLANKPGARMVRSKNQFTKAIGAFWLALFGALLPLFILKCIAGLALTGDPLYAWRK